jgi:hypothetical protein
LGVNRRRCRAFRKRILREMTGARLQASLPWLGFALLGTCTALVGGVPAAEVAWAVVSVGAALLPSGWVSPSGWRRRAAEALILPAAFALVMVGDPTLRRMILPPLLLLPALAATAAATPRARARTRVLLLACLAVAARAACGLGLAGVRWWHVGAVLLGAAAVTWAVGRLAGGAAGTIAALLAGTLPLQSAPVWLPLAFLGAAAVAAIVPIRVRADSARVRGWQPGVLASALVVASLAPWGGIAVQRALPAAGWVSVAAPLAALAVTPFVPAALSGAVWLSTTAALGPLRPPPPDLPATELTAARPEAFLPTSSGGTYMLDLALANAAALPEDVPVATVLDAGSPLVLRAGVDAAEWAHERPDVRSVAAHPLPTRPVWRPTGLGRSAVWSVAGRTEAWLPAGVRPRLVRDPHLPPGVALIAAAAGTEQPTPPRNWPLPAWMLAGAVVVALLQLASRTWSHPTAWVPWAFLTAGSLLARLAVEPLRLLAERHAVDIALAAVLAAWVPAAAGWLRRRRAFVTAAALLVPLALATPHLTPPLYGDEPFHLMVLDSLARDHDLDLANNYDLEHHPYNRIYVTGTIFLHSPVLAMLLLPGYLAGGRGGALVLLALAGAAVVATVGRRARELGVSQPAIATLAFVLLLSYPLATFSSQIWVEVVGALAAAAALVVLARPQARRVLATCLAALVTAVKTRLALVLVPLAAVAWWPRRRARDVLIGGAALAAAMAAALAVEALFLGSPLGMRHLADLLPRNPRQPVITLGGLLFDPAGGLAFAAPLALVALAGLPLLWRRGGWGERALVIGGALTVAALLSSQEWYGGGSPPARYLVPLLPAFALAGVMLLTRAGRWRSLAWLLVPPSALVWWVLLTRPQFSVNPGDGGWWLADALARRFSADARHLLPSFLRPSPATVVVPVILLVSGATIVLLAARSPRLGRAIARDSVAASLLLASAFLLVLTQRSDRVVEIEDPQVERIGGRVEPPPGTFSRFLHPQGWKVGNGEGVVVPLNLPANARLRLDGWLEGPAQAGATLVLSWDGGVTHRLLVSSPEPGSIAVPDVPGAGRHRLRITLEAPHGGDAVLDRLVVQR